MKDFICRPIWVLLKYTNPKKNSSNQIYCEIRPKLEFWWISDCKNWSSIHFRLFSKVVKWQFLTFKMWSMGKLRAQKLTILIFDRERCWALYHVVGNFISKFFLSLIFYVKSISANSKGQIGHLYKSRAFRIAYMTLFESPKLEKLISRKIWVV